MRRKSASQWQQLVEQQQASGLSATRFCQDNNLAYASFCHWRRRLRGEEAQVPSTQQTNNAAFIDLGTLLPDHARPWHIVLRLGNGIELCLNQV